MTSTFIVLDTCEDVTDKIRGDMLKNRQAFQHSNEHDEPSRQEVSDSIVPSDSQGHTLPSTQGSDDYIW